MLLGQRVVQVSHEAQTQIVSLCNTAFLKPKLIERISLWGTISMAKVTGQPLVHFSHRKQAEIVSPLKSVTCFRNRESGIIAAVVLKISID